MTEKVVADENTPLIQTDESKRKKSICPCFSWKEIKERKLKLRTFLLVLCMVSIIITSCLGGTIALSITVDRLPFSPYSLSQFITALMFLITSWLADTIIGRGKAVRLGLWCCWLGSVLYIVSFCIQYGLCGGLLTNIAKYSISVLAIILIYFGTNIAMANIPPYGQDQLVNKSSNQIRAFIHWVIWGFYLGYVLDFMHFISLLKYRIFILTIGMVVFLFDSIVLILFGTFDYKFKPSGVLKKNPYKSIYKVLKYAVQHKSPTNRSAMTYWERTAPSRIDLGKNKYGGPFTEDEVEDVKVFWRIFGIIVSTFGLHFSILALQLDILSYITKVNALGLYFYWSLIHKSTLILLIIPVMHLIVIPLVPKIDYFLVKSLRNIGALYVLMIIVIISFIIIVTIYIEVESQLVYLFAIPSLLKGLVDSLRLIFTLEFIVSQAPAYMSGMLMALFWGLQATFLSLGSLVKLPFVYLNTDGSESLTEKFWVYSIHLLVLIVGFVVYIICAWKYKRRQRDDGYYYQNVIEDTYGRILDREEIIINSSSQTLEIVSVNLTL